MDLLTMFKGQSLSPPPSDDFWYAAAGTRTAAGVNVDEAKALTYSACWAATMLLSSSEGMLPLKLFRKLPVGGSEVAMEHRTHLLINSRPNPEMTSMMFRASRTQQQINRGNCFSEIERNKAGHPENLWPIHASRIPPRNIVRKNGVLWYLVNNDDSSQTPIRAENMLHVPSPISEDGIIGLGVVTQARLSIGLGIATETHGASYFGSGATPKLVLEGGAGKFKDKQDREEFRRQWNEIHGGPENANKPAILPDGIKAVPLNFSAEDSQFLESRQFSIEEVARWYGVPPHLIGHLLRATYSNIEHLSLEFVKYSLMRWLVLWEQEINRKLLTPDEQKTMYCKHVVDALERGDLASRTAAFQQEFFNGKKTLNEWRAMDEENPIGPLGDLHFVQSAMVPLEIASKGPQEPEKPAEPEENDELSALRTEFQAKLEALAGEKHELQTIITTMQQQTIATQRQLANALLRDVMSRMLTAEISKVKHIAEKPSGFTARVQEFYGKHSANLTRSLTEPVGAVLAAMGSDKPAVDVAKQIAEAHVAESLRQLDSLLDCQTDELAGNVDLCLANWHEERTQVTV